MAAGVAVLFLGVCGLRPMDRATGTPICPASVYFRLIPHANEFTHPR